MTQSRLIDVDLEDQVTALRKELGTLKRAVARRGSSLYEDAGETISDYLSELGDRIGPSITGLRRRARTVERVAYDHPAVIAGVGLVVIGLVASLLMRRGEPVQPRRPAQQAREGSGRPSRRKSRVAAR
jgi:hypothetical protein